MADDEDDDIAANVFAAKRAAAAKLAAGDEDDNEDALQSGMYRELKKKYDELLAENREQDKTINFQKAKIAALQTELEQSLQTQAEQKTELDLLDRETGKAAEGDKKATEKIN
jgi:septal ring factor EnvC (AmiA/AmiB activator)